MKRWMLLLLALLFAGPAYGQSGVVILGAPSNDAIRTLGLVQEYETGFADNRSDFQTWLDATQYRMKPLFWPGGYANKKHFLFDDTILVPATAGLKWAGCGLQDPDGYSGSDAGSFLCLRADSWKTTFDGATNKLTAGSAGTTAIVTGHTVTSRDRWNSVHITGGTNVTQGWYGITAVDTGTNSWTLAGRDSPTANWCTGAVTDGTGYYCPALVATKSYGMVVEGLAFTHKVISADSFDGLVLWHNLTYNEAAAAPCGHQNTMRDCSFGNSQIGILNGSDLAGAYGDGSQWDEWDGQDGLHADGNVTHNLIFSNVNTCLYQRNSNGVWQHHQTWRVANLDGEVFRFDTGGKLLADTLWISGAGSGTRQCVLYLGPRVNSNMNPYIVRNVSFDDSVEHPQLLVTDFAGAGFATVLFDGGIIDSNVETPTHLDDEYLIDVDNKASITIRNFVGPDTASSPLPFWEGCIKLTGDPGVLRIENSMINIATPDDMIDEAATVAGWKVIFSGNYTGNFVPIADSTYTTLP